MDVEHKLGSPGVTVDGLPVNFDKALAILAYVAAEKKAPDCKVHGRRSPRNDAPRQLVADHRSGDERFLRKAQTRAVRLFAEVGADGLEPAPWLLNRW